MKKKYLKEVVKAISLDFRKIGVTLIGVGAAGVLIGGDMISTIDGLKVGISGVTVYAVGLILIRGD